MAAEYSLGTAHGTVKIDSDTKGVDQANEALGTLDKKAENSGMSIDKIGNRAGLAGLAIAGGFAVAVNTAASFEQQLSGIQAVSGATASEMDLIRDAALRIGKDTAFSAAEAAGAMTELAKAGVSTEDILGGVADATVALAAATGIDLPSAATYASDTMNMFGLSASDMNGIVDTLAQTANASSIDMSDLGMAMSQVGAVANLVGMSVDDTASAIGQLGDAGIKGSDAGTSLKTMLNNLQPATEAQATAMKDLGLITEDGTNKFYDQNGNLKSLRDVQGILHDSTKDLTAQQKQMALETIFGSDAIRAAAVMAENGAEGFDLFAKKQTETGTAAEQAKIRQDNLKGSLEELKGSAETLGIQIGTILIPAVKWLIEKFTELVNWLMGLDDTTKKWIVGIAGVAGGLLLLGAGIIKTVSFFKSLHSAMVTLRLISTATQASFIKTAATAVASWIKIAASAVLNAAKATAAWAAHAAKTAAAWAVMAAKATANAARVAAAWLISNGAAIATSLASMAVAVAATIGGWITMAAAAVVNAIILAAAWLIAFWPVVLIIAIVALVIAAIIIFWDEIVAAFQAGAKWVSEAMNTAWEWIKQAWDWIVQKFQAAWNWIVSIFDGIRNAISTAWNSIVNAFQQAGQNILNALNQAWTWVQNVWNSILNFFRQIPGWIGGIFSGAWNWLINAGRNILDGLRNGAVSAWNAFWGWVSGLGRSIMGIFSGAWNWLVSAGGDIIRGLWNGITGMFNWVMGKIRGFAGSVVSGIKNFFGIGSPSKVMDQEVGKWLAVGLGQGIEKNADVAVDSATTVAAQVLEAMQDGLAEGASLQATVGATLTDSMRSALAGGAPTLGATAATAVSGLKPVLHTGTSASRAAAEAANGRSVHIEMKTYNPVAEKASDSEARKIRAAAAVGAF